MDEWHIFLWEWFVCIPFLVVIQNNIWYRITTLWLKQVEGGPARVPVCAMMRVVCVCVVFFFCGMFDSLSIIGCRLPDVKLIVPSRVCVFSNADPFHLAMCAHLVTH